MKCNRVPTDEGKQDDVILQEPQRYDHFFVWLRKWQEPVRVELSIEKID
ncbi:MAG: hypothetical protein ACOYXA_01620 [Bacteroidota bacterium]